MTRTAQKDTLRAAPEAKVEPLTNSAGVNYEGSSRVFMSHEEMVQYLKNLKVMIEYCHREEREYFDRKFEETNALIRISYAHRKQQHDHRRPRDETLERHQQNY